EASQTPEMGLASADALRDMVPGAGHLVHMPSHTYIRTGDYHKGTVANLKAVAVDSNYLEACHAQGAYPLALHPHNWHFLVATATFEGNGELAMQAAKEVANRSSRKVMLEPGWGTLQHYYTTPYYVAVKFGKWDEILQMRNFDPTLKYPDAIRRYARGMAYLGKNDLTQAKQELAQLKDYAADESFKEITIWDINTTHTLLQIAKNVREGEILAKEGKYSESIQLLKSAVAIEDQLAYQEPPDWFFSVRHHLGAVLLDAGQFAEAEKIYREDLKVFKKNGWALRGLATALEKQGKKQEAAEVQQLFKTAWAYADTNLKTSRII
ncbi:MAG: tetratricopeptide repeat protein, partial [Saprospiraceae bacterium]